MPKYFFITNKYAKSLSSQTYTFKQLADNFEIPDVDSNSKDGRGILPGNYLEPFRKLNNIDFHNLLILDIDNHQESEKLLQHHFDKNSYLNQFKYIIYSTFTSDNDNKRLRLLVEIDQSRMDDHNTWITIDDYANATRTLEHNLAIKVDPFSHKRNSFVYTPRIRKNADYFFFTNVEQPRPRPFAKSDIDLNIPENQKIREDFAEFLPEHKGREFIHDDENETISDEDLKYMLAAIPADCDRSTWIRVMQAMHHFSHGAKWGYDLINEWSSRGGAKYEGPDEVWYTWDSITDDTRSPVRIGTLIYLAEQNNWREERDLRITDKYVLQIENEKELFRQPKHLINFIETVAKHRLSQHYAAKIAYELQTILHEIEPSLKKRYGGKWVDKTIDILRGRPKDIKDMSEQERQELMPEWLKRIVILTGAASGNVFIDRFTGQTWHSIQTFDTQFASEATDFGSIPSQLAVDIFHIPTVHHKTFEPNSDSIISRHGIQYLNTFVRNENQQFRSRTYFNQDQLGYIEALDTLLNTVIPNADERHILKNYFAHCVFNIGEKIIWLPLIIGAQGLGKSILANVIRASLGQYSRYTININGAQIFDNPYTALLDQKLFVGIDEVVTSPNRNKAIQDFNKFKTAVTESETIITEKYVTDRVAHNVTNYLMFSNFHRPIVLDSNERRLFVIKYPYWYKDEVKRVVTELKSCYKRLFTGVYRSGINVSPGAKIVNSYDGKLFRESMLSYFDKYRREEYFHDEFLPRGNAFKTEAFYDLALSSRSDTSAVIEECVENDYNIASKDYVAIEPLVKYIQAKENNTSSNVRVANDIRDEARQLGYIPASVGVKNSKTTIKTTAWPEWLGVTTSNVEFYLSQSAIREYENSHRMSSKTFRSFILKLMSDERKRIEWRGLSIVDDQQNIDDNPFE